MLLVGGMLIAASTAITGYCAHNYVRFMNFKKYGEDEDIRMIDGVIKISHPDIDPSTSQSNIDEQCPISVHGNTFSMEPDLSAIMLRLNIKRGIDKLRENRIPIYDHKGRYVTTVPTIEQYTDWNEIHSMVWFLRNSKINGINLDLSNTKLVDPGRIISMLGHPAKKILNGLSIKDPEHMDTNHYEFDHSIIRTGTMVSAVGNYNNKGKKFVPMFIGNRSNVLEEIRRVRYVKYPYLFLALAGFIAGGIVIADSLDSDNNRRMMY